MQSVQPVAVNLSNSRWKCNVCDFSMSQLSEVEHASVNSNVRAFKEEQFTVWRCPSCDCIHCLDKVDLDRYYSQYPLARAEASWISEFVFGNQLERLHHLGTEKDHKILDYGCGSNGLFVRFMNSKGYEFCNGYDPYSSGTKYGSKAAIKEQKYDRILLQDVIEHVEDPLATIEELDEMLRPNGFITIGTPNAASIDLEQKHIPDYFNSLHAPYHLHIYTPEALERLCAKVNWKLYKFYDRSIEDTAVPFFNTRTWNTYTKVIGDNTFDSIYEDFNYRKAVTSFKFLFDAFFGYWLSHKTNMALVFRKESS